MNLTTREKYCSLCESTIIREVGTVPIYYGNDRKSIVFDRTALFQCGNCKSLMTDIDNDTFIKHLNVCSHTNSLNEQRYLLSRKSFFKYLLGILNKHCTKNSRLLEFGTSYGHMAQLATEYGMIITGVEINDEAREIAKQMVPTMKFYKTIDDVYEDDFDAIVAIDSFYYVESPQESIVKLSARLKHNGLLFMRVTNRLWYFYLKAWRGGRFSKNPLGDARWGFSRKGLKILLERNNYKNIKFIYYESHKKHSSFLKYLLYLIGGKTAEYTKGLIFFSPGFIVMARKI